MHATFLEQPQSSTGSPESKPATNNLSKHTEPQLWKVRTAHMTYSDPDSRAHLDGGFTAVSQEFSIAGQVGDLYFSRQRLPPRRASFVTPVGTTSAAGNP